MKLRYVLFIAALIPMIGILSPAGQIQAQELPPASGEIVGPEIWGVLVLNLSNERATLRVKRVVECVVNTETHYFDPLSLPEDPDDPSDPMYYKLSGLTLFAGDPDIPTNGVPIITKVRNFKRVNGYTILGTSTVINLVSFDVQIKFCVGCPQ